MDEPNKKKTEGTTGIVEGLYQEYLNSKIKSAELNGTSKQSAESKLVPGSIIYAVFTTPQNAIPGSAVCAFRMDDIIESFEGRTADSFICIQLKTHPYYVVKAKNVNKISTSVISIR